MKDVASFQFHGRLVPMAKKAAASEYFFSGRPAIKDSIEALGVPHTEVDLIVVGATSVGFDYRLQHNDRVAVYPFGISPPLEPLVHLSPPLPNSLQFILDVHLGKLARRLRMLGFDCRYRNDYSDPQIIEQALTQGLIILTRDRGILKHARVQQGYLVGSEQVALQVLEVLERYRLRDQLRSHYRCPACNGLLQVVAKAAIRQRLPAKTARYYDDFRQCGSCRQLYWQGSHYAKIAGWISSLPGTAQQ